MKLLRGMPLPNGSIAQLRKFVKRYGFPTAGLLPTEQTLTAAAGD
ncbi:hypothetical protein [Turicimonas muris]|nr:hypothetical protein [Turicimonas muris]